MGIIKGLGAVIASIMGLATLAAFAGLQLYIGGALVKLSLWWFELMTRIVFG